MSLADVEENSNYKTTAVMNPETDTAATKPVCTHLHFHFD